VSNGSVTIRRTLQQIKHCIEEAISVIGSRENAYFALQDVEQSAALIAEVLPRIRAMGGNCVQCGRSTEAEFRNCLMCPDRKEL